MSALSAPAVRAMSGSLLDPSSSSTGTRRSARKSVAQSLSTCGASLGFAAMTVRAATPDDADAIERIRTDTWRHTYRGFMPDEVLDRLGYDGTRRRERMRYMPADEFVLVAEHDGDVVGFVNGGPSRSGDVAYPGEIYAIYALPGHHGHGHGSALMRAGARELLARGWRAM